MMSLIRKQMIKKVIYLQNVGPLAFLSEKGALTLDN